MKIFLSADLDTEAVAVDDALRGAEWRMVAQDMDEFLRGNIKHGGKKWQPVRDHLNTLIQGRNLQLYR